jgi:DNA-binding NarL/FixJ family response regulator
MLETTVIRVMIVEDRRDLRAGLRALIHNTPGFVVTGDFRTMEEALAELSRTLPDVVLADLGLPGMPGIEGIRRIRQDYPPVQVLVLTVHDDDDRIFQAICAGACGYLLKHTPPARLLEAIGEIAAGGAPMSPEVARQVVQLFHKVKPPEHSDYRLTAQETRLLKLLVEGHSYKTAAVELGVSLNTVSFHVRAIYEKLRVHSKSEAVAKALRERLVN